MAAKLRTVRRAAVRRTGTTDVPRHTETAREKRKADAAMVAVAKLPVETVEDGAGTMVKTRRACAGVVYADRGIQQPAGGFAIGIRDDTQVQTEPDDYMRAQKVPGAAQLEERAAGVVQVQDVPATVLRDERAAGDVPVQAVLVATTYLQAEEASDGTEMGHCHPRALKQLVDKATTGVKFNRNIELLGDCGVRAVGDMKKAIYLKNRTPTEVLGGTVPHEVWQGKPLGDMSHIHEWGSVAYTHEEARFRNTKLSARATKVYHVAYNTKNRTYRLWEPAEPLKNTNFAEVSFREFETRDVIKPKEGVSNAPERMNLHTTEEAYERTEHALLTGSVLGNIGTGRPGEAGYRPADPASYYGAAVNGTQGELWKESVSDEGKPLYKHDVFDWVDPPKNAKPIPSRFHFVWKYNQDGVAVRAKTRVVVQGFYEADTGADKAAPVASMESVLMMLAVAAHNHLVLKQADIKTTFLPARIPEEAEPTYVIPPKGFPCSPGQVNKSGFSRRGSMACASPRRDGTSTADPCLYSLQDGEVLLLVDYTWTTSCPPAPMKVTTVISQLKERFETVDLGDAKFLLGMVIQRHLNAGTLLLTQEAYTKAVLAKFNMADAHPTKTPAEVGPITTAEDEVLSPEDTKNFRSATGSVLYLFVGERGRTLHTHRWCLSGAWRNQAAKQPLVAVSLVEAEYVALSKACQLIIPFRHLLMTLARAQTKHIDIKDHHIRSLIQDGVVKVEKIESAMQKADVFTKSLGAVKFIKNRMMLLGE
ncbi:unnamed protein product [Ectocarpus sp. CCAP 1310/34]|nr:unnamed protein product [Ectocarpus sp. CCAP 1310/34]